MFSTFRRDAPSPTRRPVVQVDWWSGGAEISAETTSPSTIFPAASFSYVEMTIRVAFFFFGQRYWTSPRVSSNARRERPAGLPNSPRSRIMASPGTWIEARRSSGGPAAISPSRFFGSHRTTPAAGLARKAPGRMDASTSENDTVRFMEDLLPSELANSHRDATRALSSILGSRPQAAPV